MFKKNIYKYKKDNMTILSVYEPDCEYEKMLRLVANERCLLTKDGVKFVFSVDIKEVDESIWVEVDEDSLEEVSGLKEIQNEIVEIEKGQSIQDGDIISNMLATTEIFEMMLEFIPITLSDDNNNLMEGMVGNMVEVYVTLIIKGYKTIDDVPVLLRDKVNERLKQLELA
jgi:hypothetical protein